MPTNEERRKIAARLRASHEFINSMSKISLEQNAFDAFERILVCVGYERGNIFNYLAELIEPEHESICKIEAFDNGLDEDYDGSLYSYAPPTYYLSCGHEAYQCKPNYCPDCGAKVK